MKYRFRFGCKPLLYWNVYRQSEERGGGLPLLLFETFLFVSLRVVPTVIVILWILYFSYFFAFKFRDRKGRRQIGQRPFRYTPFGISLWNNGGVLIRSFR